MRRTPDETRRGTWRGAGDAWAMVSDLIAGMLVWGAIGYGIDAWLKTGPAFLIAGALVGHIAGVYLVIRKGREMSARAVRERGERYE